MKNKILLFLAYFVMTSNFVAFAQIGGNMTVDYTNRRIQTYTANSAGPVYIQSLSTQGAGDHTILNQYAGKVGIGNTTIDRKLNVQGNAKIVDFVVSPGNPDNGTYTFEVRSQDRLGMLLRAEHVANYRTALQIEATNGYSKGISIGQVAGVNYTEGFRVYANGKGYFASSLSIGTQNNIDNATGKIYSLSVNGFARVKELKVYPAWADYVFEDSYNLMPLDQLKSFVATNNHLPNIATASEVAESGINVGETNAKLLEKIEELTLYVIQLNDELGMVKQQMSNTQIGDNHE